MGHKCFWTLSNWIPPILTTEEVPVATKKSCKEELGSKIHVSSIHLGSFHHMHFITGQRMMNFTMFIQIKDAFCWIPGGNIRFVIINQPLEYSCQPELFQVDQVVNERVFNVFNCRLHTLQI